MLAGRDGSTQRPRANVPSIAIAESPKRVDERTENLNRRDRVHRSVRFNMHGIAKKSFERRGLLHITADPGSVIPVSQSIERAKRFRIRPDSDCSPPTYR